MTDTFDPLDFEFEEPIRISPSVPKKKKKVIGLDDLLEDHAKEQKRINEKKSKRKKIKNTSDSEEDEDAREKELSKCVDKCQKEMDQINDDDEVPLWGIQVFGDQRTFPALEHPEPRSCFILQSIMNNKLNSLVELTIEKGEPFLEGLLVDGWLLKLILTQGRVEKSISTWTFNLMLYSSKEWLRKAACEFWCSILSPGVEANASDIKIDWLPSYSDLKRAFDIYGYLLDSPSKRSSDIDMIHADSETAGPPQNIRCWIKYVAACCQVRNTHIIFSTSEAEDFLGVIISLFLDRQLLGLSMILNACMYSVISFFKDEEWHGSCERVAKSLGCRLPRDINCLRTVESISGSNGRSKHLRSAVAKQFLIRCLNEKECDAEDILRMLISINVKDKNCDLSKMYIYLGLAENWLLFDPTLKDNAQIHEMWRICLRNCSCGIAITDLRSYASKVRSKASYLLQAMANK